MEKRQNLNIRTHSSINDSHALIDEASFFSRSNQSILTVQTINRRHETNVVLAFFLVQFKSAPSPKETNLFLHHTRMYDLMTQLENGNLAMCMIAPLNEKELRSVAHRLLKDFPAETKIGISLFPMDLMNTDANTQTNNQSFLAQKLLHCAKQSIKNDEMGEVYFYHANLAENSKKYAGNIKEIKQDLHNGAFDFYYQPKYNVQEEIKGAEALLRRPTNTSLGILDIIDLAEESGLILKIGEQALQVNLERMMSCVKNNVLPPALSINVSPAQLSYEWYDFCQFARNFDFVPNSIELEITESTLTSDSRVKKQLHELKAMGFNISIDDFGVKESSLSRLAEYPIDVIKIDKSFVDGLYRSNRASTAVIKAMISIGKELDIKVVAEGVEYKEQAEQLFDMGCDLIQGYYYSRPLPYDTYYSLISRPCKH